MAINEKKLKNLIYEKYENLSKGQQKIADFIILNSNEMVDMTAKDLACKLKLSESTIVRFAQELGFEGYRDLKEIIIDDVKSTSTSIDRMNIFSEVDAYTSSIYSSVSSEISYLKKLELIDKSTVKEIVENFLTARKIYLLGCRTSHFLASYFNFYLKILLDNVCLLGENETTIFEEMVDADENDLLFVISYPRYTRLMLEVVQHAKNKNVKIASLTDNDSNKLSKMSDLSIAANNNLLFFVDSLVVPMAIINGIIVDISMSNRQNTINSLSQMEDLWKKYNIFDTEWFREVIMKRRILVAVVAIAMVFTTGCKLFSDGDINARKVATLKEEEKMQIANELASIVLTEDEKFNFITEKMLDQIALTKDDKTVAQLRTQIEANKANLYESYLNDYKELNAVKTPTEEEKIVNIPFLDNIVEVIKNIYTGAYESEETFTAAIENFNADYQNAFRMVRDEGKTYEGLEYTKTIVTVDNPREYRAELKGSDKTIYIYLSESNGILNLSRIVAE